MTASATAFSAIRTAGQHLGATAIQPKRAQQCYDRADCAFCANQFAAAVNWAAQSLQYSVGTGHSDFARVLGQCKTPQVGQ